MQKNEFRKQKLKKFRISTKKLISDKNFRRINWQFRQTIQIEAKIVFRQKISILDEQIENLD